METSSDDAEKSKPHPDIFEAARAKLHAATAAEIVVVGDTPYNAEAASRAGIRAIGLCSGGWLENDLRKSGCVEVYADIATLLNRYDTSALTRT